MESTFRVLAWVAKIREEKDYSRWIANLEIQTHSMIFAFPSKDSERYLVIFESRYGMWERLKLNLFELSWVTISLLMKEFCFTFKPELIDWYTYPEWWFICWFFWLLRVYCHLIQFSRLVRSLPSLRFLAFLSSTLFILLHSSAEELWFG